MTHHEADHDSEHVHLVSGVDPCAGHLCDRCQICVMGKCCGMDQAPDQLRVTPFPRVVRPRRTIKVA